MPGLASEPGGWSDVIEPTRRSAKSGLACRSGCWSAVPNLVDVLDPASHPPLSITQRLCQDLAPGPRPDFLGGRQLGLSELRVRWHPLRLAAQQLRRQSCRSAARGASGEGPKTRWIGLPFKPWSLRY